MFKIVPGDSTGAFMVVSYDRYKVHTVLKGFYSGLYGQFVVTHTEDPWWFTSSEYREIADLMDSYREDLTSRY